MVNLYFLLTSLDYLRYINIRTNVNNLLAPILGFPHYTNIFEYTRIVKSHLIHSIQFIFIIT